MVRFGIVGFGLHAVKRLMPGFSLAKNCAVTALSRRDLAAAKKSAAEHRIPLAFDSATALCRSPEVDAILVTTPNAMHLADVLTAISAGKPVLCEKPMAVSAGECRQMVQAARENKVLLGVAHVFRFEESTRYLRRQLADGVIGRPLFARSEFSFNAGPSHPRKWLYDADVAGAGPIFDIGVHCVDSLRFILQDEVAQVGAVASTDPRSGSVESSATLTLQFERGTLATVMVSFRAGYRTPIELVGSDAVIRAENAFSVDNPVEVQVRLNSGDAETVTLENRLAYSLQVDAFADAVEGRSRFPATAEDGWQNQEILDAALRSIRSGRAERVPRVL
jgi:predicted dehydrogenase